MSKAPFIVLFLLPMILAFTIFFEAWAVSASTSTGTDTFIYPIAGSATNTQFVVHEGYPANPDSPQDGWQKTLLWLCPLH